MATSIVMPSFGMYTAEGTLVAWLRGPGDPIEAGEPVAEIETDKATYEIPAPATGRVHQVLTEGAPLKEEIVLGYVLELGEAAPPHAVAAPSNDRTAGRDEPATAANGGNWTKATPVARRLAAERGIALETLTGSGPGGRIVEADVLAATPPPARSDGFDTSTRARVRGRVPFTGLRRATAERLKQSQSAAVALTLTREVPATPLVAAHEELRRQTGAAVPLDAFFVKLLAQALREQPELNVVVERDELVLLDEVSIGVAVAVDDGLVVPVICDADQLTLREIGRRIRSFAERARSSGLDISDIDGGTSTVTNLGAFGVDAFTPVLNPPQSSILGVGRVASRASLDDDAARLAPSVWLSLTFDHRVADGVAAARLLDCVARLMLDEDKLAELVEEE